MHCKKVKQYKKKTMGNFKVYDIVKWVNPVGALEKQDVMVVNEVDGNFLTVRHLSTGKQDSDLTTIWADNVRVVGTCTASEPVADILHKYINV